MHIRLLDGVRKLDRPCSMQQWSMGAILNNAGSSQAINGIAADGEGGLFILISRWDGNPDHRLYLNHVSAAGTVTCNVLLDTTPGTFPNYSPLIYGYHQCTLILTHPQGPAATPTCIVVWASFHGPVVAERFDAMGNRLWMGPVTLAQSSTFDNGFPAAIRMTAGSGLVLFHSINPAGSLELRITGITESGTQLGPMNGSLIAVLTVSPQFPLPGRFEAVPVSGGACVFWQEPVNPSPIATWTISARFVDSSGVPTGGPFRVASPVVTHTPPGPPYILTNFPRAVEDNSGGFFIAYTTPQGPPANFWDLELKLDHFPAGSNTAAATAIIGIVQGEGYCLSSDGQGNVVMAWEPGSLTGGSWNFSLFAGHFDAQCINLWSSASPVAYTGFDWPPIVVPTTGGGAIVVYQNSAVNMPGRELRVSAQCLDAQGLRMGYAAQVSPLGSLYPLGIQCAPGIAGVVFRAFTGMSAQRIGCCGRDPQGEGLIPIPPRLFCEIPVDLPSVPYGGFLLNLPCGERDSFRGILPLDQLARIPGIESPGFLTSRDAPTPDWVEILFLGIPQGVTLTLRDAGGKLVTNAEVIAHPDSIPGHGHREGGRVLMFRPQQKQNYVLLFEARVRFDRAPLISVHMRFGEDSAE